MSFEIAQTAVLGKMREYIGNGIRTIRMYSEVSVTDFPSREV